MLDATTEHRPVSSPEKLFSHPPSHFSAFETGLERAKEQKNQRIQQPVAGVKKEINLRLVSRLTTDS
jgi:hypothetical protein